MYTKLQGMSMMNKNLCSNNIKGGRIDLFTY